MRNISNYIHITIIAVLISLLPAFSFAANAGDKFQSSVDSGRLHKNIKKQVELAGTTEAIVILDSTDANAAAVGMKQRLGIKHDSDDVVREKGRHHKKKKDDLLAAVNQEGYTTLEDFDLLPVIHVRMDKAALAKLLDRPEVAYIGENMRFSRKLTESLPLVDAVVSTSAGFSGFGTSVAVLDTGVNYTLAAFGGCTSPGVPAGCRVSYTQSFAANNGALDSTGHGTNVAAIVLGVAPDARILGLNVFRPDGFAYETDVIRALQWVLSNRGAYNIAVANLSFGVGGYTASCPNLPLSRVINDLKSAGVATVIASGNDGFIDALSYPACSPDAVSVGAVYDANMNGNLFLQEGNCTDSATAADQVACFSNSAPFLTMLAPGSVINAAGIAMSGTSQAAPHVAGAVALLKSNDPTLPVDNIVARLAASGIPVTDARNGITKPRLNVFSGINSTLTGTNADPANQANGNNQPGVNAPASGNNGDTTDKGSTTLNNGHGKKNNPEMAGPGWYMLKGEPVTHTQAMAHINARSKQLRIDKVKRSAKKSDTTAFSAMSASSISPEITELARALRHDPKQIYDYVHNKIDYVPYFGYKKSPTLTYLDGKGNDFDQASLMISLLRTSGYSAQFVYGKMAINYYELANWLGVDPVWGADYDVVYTKITAGGIPYDSDTGKVYRVWVKATINGVDYLFDPAFKQYDYPATSIDVGAAMGYSQADFLAAATSGATITGDYAQNMNEGNVRSKLTGYAMNLVNTIRTQYPNKGIDELMGGRSIKDTTLSQYATTLPYSPETIFIWDEIPDGYSPTMRIRHAGIDVTYKAPDLDGMRLTMTYDGMDNHPELRLDGVLQASGSGTAPGYPIDYTITMTHPVAAYNGTYGNQEVTSQLKSGGSYAMLYTFNDISDALLQKRQRLLDGYIAQGLPNSSEAVRGETLNIMGMTWMKEDMMVNRLLSGITGISGPYIHTFGVMAQENGYYISIEGIMQATASRHNRYDMASLWKHSLASGNISSGLEHGILEQLMGSDKPGISTVKGLQLANATGRKVFRATSANFSAVRPQLVGYTTAQLNDFSNLVNNNGCSITLPDNGQLALGQWQGEVHLSFCYPDVFPHTGWMVSSIQYGGVAAQSGDVNPGTVSGNTAPAQNNNYCPAMISGIYSPIEISVCRDPVDMASGAYLFDNTDLALGGSAPLGLSFARTYSSNRNQTKRTLGYGWSHNNDVNLTSISDANPVLGMRQPVDAASMIAALYVNYDLMKNQDNVTGWMAAALTSKWAVDQTIDNAVTLQAGNKTMEFIKLADGTYSSPPGITSKLQKNSNGTYSLIERFGMRSDFDTSKRITKITDVDGNYSTFSYSGDKLTTIQDAAGRTLTLDYDTSGRVQKVTDSTGRFVTYGYDANGDLNLYTDPENKNWSYGYTSPHLMTTMTNPLQVTAVTNLYDSLNRVKSQIEPRQGAAGTTATYNYYISGYKNMLEDPFGQTTSFFYDTKGREYAQKNALGFGSTKVFDGQDHVAKIFDPRGYLTGVFTYDGNHNMTKESNDPTYAPIWAYDNTNSYDTQFRLTDSTDHNGHNTHYEYDTKHHLTLTRDGAGNTNLASYNGPYSLRDTATDGKGTVTTFTYDTYGNPQTKKTGDHPAITYQYDAIGRMTGLTDQVGSLTTFEYDRRGLVTRIIDPSRTNATTFQYYDDGKLWQKTDRKGSTITYSYTPSGKLAQISYPSGTPVSYTYNLHDQLVAMQDSIGTTTYSYDAAGRLSSFTNPYGFTISYAYDAAGNVTEITYPGGKKVTYTYDPQNRVYAITPDWLANPTYALYVYKQYEKGNVPDTVYNLDFSTAGYTFDLAHRLTNVHNYSTQYNMTLDANGNRTGIERLGEPLLPLISDNPAKSYSYNGTKNRLLSDGANGFGYDNEGQLNSGYGSSYTFDYEHRLTGISGVAQYSYDGAGNRLQAVRNGVVTRYVYDAAGNLIAEADGNNTISRYYVYGTGLLAMVTPNGQVYNYQFDPGGNVVELDAQSTRKNAYVYDPFGAVINQQEEIAQPFKFVGQYGVMAEPNGMYYMKARYYDPKVGRFISEDPLGFGGGDVNLMAYVGNQPVNFVDPSGLEKSGGGGYGFTIFGGSGSKAWGVDANVSISFSKSGISVSVQGSNITKAYGAYVGWGRQVNVNVGNPSPDGGSSSMTNSMGSAAGWGAGGSTSVNYGPDGVSLSGGGGRVGGGYGAGFWEGNTFSGTWKFKWPGSKCR